MRKIYLLILMLSLSAGLKAQDDTIRVLYYNLLNYPGTTYERFEYFADIMYYAQPDLILVNEITTEMAADTLLDSALNINGVNHFARAAFTNGYDSDNMLFYNSNKFTLYAQDEIPTPLRLINEYSLYSVQGADTVFLRMYSCHLKASQGYEANRLVEIEAWLAHIDSLSSKENIMIGGDFNFYYTEPAYDTIINTSVVNMTDVLYLPGYIEWHADSAYKTLHTQSTRDTQFGGGASGGMDDRFDFIFMSSDIVAGNHKIVYVPGSYTPLGNDGLHFNTSIIAAPVNASVPDTIAEALYYMSDHLPVMADFVLASSTAIEEQRQNALAVYPNPFTDYLIIWLHADASPIVSAEVYDINGRMLISEMVAARLDFSDYDLDPGLYMLVVRTGNKTYTSRIIAE